MATQTRAVLCICALLLAVSPWAAAQSAADGQTAFTRGDYTQAERLWRPLAERGDAAAQTGMGNLHAGGRGVPQDFAAAAAWYTKAASQGNVVAQTVLASFYMRGNGVAQDDVAAVQWYRRAAEQGHAPAQSSLGFLLENGRGGPKDEPQAVQWYRKAAVQGDAVALANLGSMAEEGRGLPRDDVLAGALLSRAAAVSPTRQDIATLAQSALNRLQGAQRIAYERQLKMLAEPNGVAKVLASLDTNATGSDPAAAAGPATATGETELQGMCRLFEGELAGGGATCPNRAVVAWVGTTPVIRIVDGATRRVLAEFRFDTASRLSSGDGAANLNVASLNGQPAGGTCTYQYPGGLRPAAGSVSPHASLVCGASSMGAQPRPLVSWGIALLDAKPGERERWTAALNAVRDHLNPAMSDAAIAAAQSAAQAEANRRPATPTQPVTPSAPAKPSEDPKAIFGLLVGGKLPAMRACREGEDMPKDQPWCFERDNSGNASLANLLTERAEFYRKAGAVPFQVKVNAEMFDTSLLFAFPLLGNLPWIELWVTRGDMTIQMLSVNTRLNAVDAISSMLTRKYGRPTRRDDTEWSDNQTGQIVRRTPNLRWTRSDLAVDYVSQSTGMLFNEPTRSGSITIHAAEFARKVNDIERQSAPPPKRGM